MLKRRMIEEILLKAGISAGNKGFGYIADAVMLLDTPEWKDVKYIALYEKIGEMNGTTGARVERCIRHAFESARERMGDTDDIIRYIGGKKTSNSDALKMLYTRLKGEDEAGLPEIKIGDRDLDETVLRRIIREEVRALLKGILLGGDTL